MKKLGMIQERKSLLTRQERMAQIAFMLFVILVFLLACFLVPKLGPSGHISNNTNHDHDFYTSGRDSDYHEDGSDYGAEEDSGSSYGDFYETDSDSGSSYGDFYDSDSGGDWGDSGDGWDGGDW